MSGFTEIADLGVKFHLSAERDVVGDIQEFNQFYSHIMSRIDSYGSHLNEREQMLGQTWLDLPSDFKLIPFNHGSVLNAKQDRDKTKNKEIIQISDQKSYDLTEIINHSIKSAENSHTIDALKKAVLSVKLDIPEQKFAKQPLFYEGHETPDILWIQDSPTEQDDANGSSFSDASGLMIINLFKQLGYQTFPSHATTKTIGFAHMTFWPVPPRQTTDILDMNYQACLPFISKLIQLTKPSMVFLSGLESVRFLTQDAIQGNNFQLKPVILNDYPDTKSFIIPSRFLLQKSSILKKKFWFDLLSVFYNNS